MIKPNFQLLILIFLFFSLEKSFSQSAPVWVKDLNALPDSSDVFPVRTITDMNNNILVLSTYSKSTGPNTKNKVYLKKHTPAGGVLWTLVYDNNGIGQPRGFDMAVDNAGNCYIAGGFMATASFKPMLLKVNSSGTVAWQRDSTAAFNAGTFDQVTLWNSKLYLRGTNGIAQFDINGNENWSNGISTGTMTVDHMGQMICSYFVGNPNNVYRCDSNGVQNLNIASINATRIAVDANNSFYLLGDIPRYELVKFDSAGTFQWNDTVFPVAPPFGDIGLEVLTDFNDDVIVVGLSDTMFKFNANGNLLWSRPMNGLDAYLITAKVVFNNFLAIAGSIQGSNGNDLYVSWFDLQGIQNWAGTFSGNTNLTEFTRDLAIDNLGVYVVENNNNKTTLVKFDSPLNNTVVDYTKVCIDSVWYDNGNHNYYNVRVFNGNIASLNYPSVRMVSVFGDTTGNPYNNVGFFAHLGNSYMVYHDTITDPFITDFVSIYTYFVCENFGDTMTQVGWCSPLGMEETDLSDMNMYPNPAHDWLVIDNPYPYQNMLFNITDAMGRSVWVDKKLLSGQNRFSVSGLRSGIYMLSIQSLKGRITRRICIY